MVRPTELEHERMAMSGIEVPVRVLSGAHG
jgi:hypothetical protein